MQRGEPVNGNPGQGKKYQAEDRQAQRPVKVAEAVMPDAS
jgi:hypothetical protein